MNEQVKQIAQMYINNHPNLGSQIANLAEMANDEINSGESPDNEIELMIGSIQDLVNEEIGV